MVFRIAIATTFFHLMIAAAVLPLRMHIRVNMAMTLDGKTSAPGGGWKPGKADRIRMDHIRAECDALLIGVHTLILDNPNVMVKHDIEKSPLPVIVVRKTLPPGNLRIFQGPRPPLIIADESQKGYLQTKELDGLEWEWSRGTDARSIVKILEKRGLRTLLVEGGPTMNDLFFAENLVDRLHLTLVSRVLGGKADTVDRMPVHRAFKLVKQESADEELFLEYERVSQS